jgi:hypothetical protein
MPAVMTYAMMVSRDMIRIALTIMALNDLEVKTSDIKNAYLQYQECLPDSSMQGKDLHHSGT